MAKITIELPDLDQEDFIAALSAHYRYVPNVQKRSESGITVEANPQSAEDFVAEALAKDARRKFVSGGITLVQAKAEREFRAKYDKP